ncbi:ABC-F family ATP-binding cassette domain-containing protein [Algihabitans albus]|uniref:ABC-F family ATP-binding cassette domain-containing protein n=1 Tax=Algihabitans albus TaxID=2164067 RepID=UPI000E5CC6AE|nr:ABC-F family ATP-binding cassette domain-containing protein [Algihabitans albus]
MLHVNDMTFRHGGRTIFERATVALERGWRVGMVGRNGAGKTTLLKLIAGDLHPDGGEVRLMGRVRVGTVAQEAPGGARSLIDTVLAADSERTALLTEAETVSDPARLAEVHERLAVIRAEAAPARAARVLAGLGFDEAAQRRPCAEFSGGWRMRVALAALLFAEPDLLLLDEPTNHLDLEAAIWLETYLKSYPGTLLLVSHDRGLLNRTVDRILHVEAERLSLYQGNYDRFERTRRERLEREAATNTKIQAQRRHIQAFVDRFRAKATKARQAQSRLKMLEKLQPIVSVVENQTVRLDFPRPEPLSPPILSFEGASVGYCETPVLQGLNLRIDMEDRVALLGANGNGKSTLARLLAGRLKPLAGRLARSPKLRVGYFAQDQAEALDLTGTALTNLRQLMPMATEEKLRSHLGRFGFSADKADTQAAKLSGGEKARLLFALVSREQPHLLILDEPTNHLDVDAREALVQALGDFEGGVILVSHDPHLVELVADRLWLVQEGTVRPFEGDMADYRQLLLDQRRAERRQAKAEARSQSGASGQPDARDRRRQAAAQRTAVADLKKTARQAEARLEKLQAALDLLEQELADPSLYDGPADRLTRLQTKHAEVKAAIAETEERWLEAQGDLEAAG